jgi:XTP/dITP diphosphohydrolase
MTLVFASNNIHKIREIRSILGDSFTLLSLEDINLSQDIPENEPFLEGNALSKARFIHKTNGMNVFADDTGLEIDELNGLPGVQVFNSPYPVLDSHISDYSEENFIPEKLIFLGGENHSPNLDAATAV